MTMSNKKTYKSKPLESSLRNNILLTFFLILAGGIIANNIIFFNIIQTTLSVEGLDAKTISNISRYFTIVSTSVTIAGILIILLIALYFTESITRPLKKLMDGMIDIAKGQWSTRIDVSSPDELGQLADGFNYMVEHVEGFLQEIKAAKEYTDNIVISVPSILVVLNYDLKILSTNIAFDKLHEQFPTISLKQFVTKLEDEIRENQETGETASKEISLIPEGSETNLIFSSLISRIGDNGDDYNEDTPRVLLTITDITERKKMKELVLQSKQDWEDTFNTIPDMITIHDKNFNIIHANSAAKKNLNLPIMDPGKINKCYKYYHGTDYAPEECPSCNCMNTAESSTFEIYEPHLKKFVEVRAIPRINYNKELIGLIHIVRDITHRKKIEDERNILLADITKAKIEWELTFDSATEFIVLINKDLRITRCNRSFSDFVNKPLSEIVGRNCHEFFPSLHDNSKDGNNNSKASQEFSLKSELKTNSDRWLYISHRPIEDDKSKTLHSVIIATDITELKNAQHKIRESEKELQKKVEDLEKFYDLAIGREVRMKELKKEIKRVNAKLEYYEGNVVVKQ